MNAGKAAKFSRLPADLPSKRATRDSQGCPPAPPRRGWTGRAAALIAGDMDIRQITPAYAVSPQIAPEDVPALKAAGFTTVICNRPDPEVPPSHQAEAVRAAVEAAGLTFVENPFSHAAFDFALVETQADAIAASDGPTFAYCASGNRSSVLWAMGAVKAGEVTPAEAIAAARAAGYDLSGLAPQLEMLANS